MDQADEELRETINMIWPFQAKKMLDLLIPRNDRLNRINLTVGKVYAGFLILESWRNTRFGQIESGIPVSFIYINIIKRQIQFTRVTSSGFLFLLLILLIRPEKKLKICKSSCFDVLWDYLGMKKWARKYNMYFFFQIYIKFYFFILPPTETCFEHVRTFSSHSQMVKRKITWRRKSNAFVG